MEAVLSSLISQLNSSVFILIGIFVIAFISVHKMSKWIGRWEERHLNITDKIKGYDVITRELAVLSKTVELIYLNTNKNSSVQHNSPISLTPIGKEIYSSVGLDKIYTKYKNKLVKELEDRNINNAYDIQEEALLISETYLPTILSAEELTLVKNTAFQRGLRDKDILIIIGIVLRDDFLLIKNISASDIDIHNPVNK